MEALTKFDLKDSIATITMDRDEKRNAFNASMTAEVFTRIDQAERAGARVVILRANRGAKIWCAGHDLTELASGDDFDFAKDPMEKLLERIQSLPIPFISMVEGAAYGGGMLLTLVSDIVIAADNATLAMTANKMGVPFPTGIYAYWLRVCGIHKAKELLFTAEPIPAQDAYASGLFNHVVSLNELESFTYETIARAIIGCSKEGVADSKLQLNLLAERAYLMSDDEKAIEADRLHLMNDPDFKRRVANLLARIHKK